MDNKPVLRFRKPTIREYYGLGNIENLKVDIVPSYPGADSTCNWIIIRNYSSSRNYSLYNWNKSGS
ncbi:MAG: hypothetical protein GX185_03195 [Tissierellia bacterium]|nr:hypothetical protein [Tissierellia bacterium]